MAPFNARVWFVSFVGYPHNSEFIVVLPPNALTPTLESADSVVDLDPEAVPSSKSRASTARSAEYLARLQTKLVQADEQTTKAYLSQFRGMDPETGFQSAVTNFVSLDDAEFWATSMRAVGFDVTLALTAATLLCGGQPGSMALAFNILQHQTCERHARDTRCVVRDCAISNGVLDDLCHSHSVQRIRLQSACFENEGCSPEADGPAYETLACVRSGFF